MRARKCDRCGKIYVEGDDGTSIKSIVIHKQDWNGYYSLDPVFIDLCPSCLDELVDFLVNKEEEEGEVKHTCCCNEKKSNIDADLVKGILDELLKVDRVSPLEIHFGSQFFNQYHVKGEKEDE